MNRKIDWERVLPGAAIWCKTEDEARALLQEANRLGYTWYNGSSLLEKTYWGNEREDTVYVDFDGTGVVYGNKNRTRKKVVPFSELLINKLCEHSFATKYTCGDAVYLISQAPVSKRCPMCHGTKLYDGERCPACHATGFIQMERKEWKVMDEPFVIDHFRVSINKNGVSAARYHGHIGLKSVNRAEENLFETVEAAQAECDRRNLVRMEVALSDIKIFSCFAKTIPAANKLAKRVEEYKQTGRFATEIYVNKDMELWDGYTTYMVCRMLDIKAIKVVVKDRVCEVKTAEPDEDDEW